MLGDGSPPLGQRLRALSDPELDDAVRSTSTMRLCMPGEDLVFVGPGGLATPDGKMRILALTTHMLYLLKPASVRPCRLRLSLRELKDARVRVCESLGRVHVLDLVTRGKTVSICVACPKALCEGIESGKALASADAKVMAGASRGEAGPHMLLTSSVAEITFFN